MATHSNTGPCTLNVNGLGVKAITKAGTVILAGGEIVANQVVRVVYDGTEFQLISVGALNYLKPGVDGTASVTIRKADGTTSVIVVDTLTGRLGVNVTPTCELDAGPSGTVNAGTYTSNGQALAKILANSPQLAAGPNFAVDTGSLNAYSVALSQLSAYSAGMVVLMLALTSNTGSATLNINGWGAKTITREGNQALTGGEIAAGQIVMLVYDGTYFQLVGASSTVYAP
jgi:hypothetical protein